jgi:carboxyl-terminal processing protease
VQQLKDLPDGSSIKITIAHWVLPKGQILEGKGLTPDVLVKLTDADTQAGKDPQLDKALQVVKGQ